MAVVALRVLGIAFPAHSQVFVTGVEGPYQQLPFARPGQRVTLRGGGFVSGQMSVFFNDVQGLNVFVGGQDQLMVDIAPGTPVGTNPVRVVRTGFPPAFSPPFEVIGPEPYVVGFNPTLGIAGQTQVDIEAVNVFNVGPLSVHFNDTLATSGNLIGQNLIRVTAPAGAMNGPISVTSSFGTGSSKSNFFFPPVITGTTPTKGIAGTVVNIHGMNLLGATALSFAPGVAAPLHSVANTNVTTTVPAGARTGRITLTTVLVTQSPTDFVLLPTLGAFLPPAGPVGTEVNIHGTNLFNVSSVTFNGVEAAGIITNAAGTNVITTVPTGATSGLIVVTTPAGSVTSSVPFFLPPSITSFNPMQGLAGTPVTITGQNFLGATNVTFNNVAANFDTNGAGTQITATVPHGALTGPIRVHTPGGTATSSQHFLVPPVIFSFAPGSGLPGDLVDIFGSNFTFSASVQFGGSNAASVFLSAARLQATVPSNAPTGLIRVITEGGFDDSDTPFIVLSLEIELTARLNNGLIVLSWPTNVPGWSLQSTTNLLPVIQWSPVNATTSVVNGLFTVTNPAAHPMEYFRLRRP